LPFSGLNPWWGLEETELCQALAKLGLDSILGAGPSSNRQIGRNLVGGRPGLGDRPLRIAFCLSAANAHGEHHSICRSVSCWRFGATLSLHPAQKSALGRPMPFDRVPKIVCRLASANGGNP
jgi:hypothetical protein